MKEIRLIIYLNNILIIDSSSNINSIYLFYWNILYFGVNNQLIEVKFSSIVCSDLFKIKIDTYNISLNFKEKIKLLQKKLNNFFILVKEKRKFYYKNLWHNKLSYSDGNNNFTNSL
jgi:hypothetical protein